MKKYFLLFVVVFCTTLAPCQNRTEMHYAEQTPAKESEYNHYWGTPQADFRASSMKYISTVGDGCHVYLLTDDPGERHSEYFVFKDGELVKFLVAYHDPEEFMAVYRDCEARYGNPYMATPTKTALMVYAWIDEGTAVILTRNEDSFSLGFEEYKQ